jgi:hypothetical protein
MLTTHAALILILSIAPLPVAGQSVTAQRETVPASTVPGYQVNSKPRPPVEFPEAPGAWIVEINRTGGLAGIIWSHVILSSNGSATIFASFSAPRTRTLKVSDGLPELDRLIQTLDTGCFKGTASMPPSLCRDCVGTRLSIYRLEGEAKMEYRATWDETTHAKMAESVLGIYGLASQIAHTASTKRISENPAKPK